MFKENDLVMYGAAGVCRVVDIGKPDFAKDQDREYYYLEPLYQSGVIYAPTEGNPVSMRYVISKNEATNLLDSIPEIEAEVFVGQSLQQLSQHYQSIINTHDCRALLGLAKSIREKEAAAVRKNKRLGQIDRRYMRMTEDLLYGEFAAALGIAREEAEVYVRSKLT